MERELQHLEELIRQASHYLLTKEDKIGYLNHPNLKKRLQGDHPECFISLKAMGRIGRNTSSYMLPICNRAAIVDPDVINVSIRAIQKLMADQSGNYDVNELQGVLDKLTRLKARYDKPIPKPPARAGRKAVVTRMFNNIKRHLVAISPKE
jgi:hypothetical protein